MYDKVKLWIDRALVGEQYNTIANNLEDAKQETDLNTGEVKTYGSVEGLRVSVFVGGLSVMGSLSKFLYGGSNVYPLDRHTTAEAMEKLSDTLHIKADEASVTELEFGTNFLMKHQVSEYLVKLGDMPRLSRYHFNPNTLYYKGMGKQQPKVYAFYDKIADAMEKGMDYPSNLKGENLLRYEMRMKGRLSQQMGVPEVRASTLYDRPFYRKMVKRYQDTYFSISKFNQIKIDAMGEIRNVTDAFNLFVALLMKQTDKTMVRKFLDELKAEGVFEDRKYYYRLQKKIDGVTTKADFFVTDELMKELDDEIKNCGAYV